MPPSTPVFRFAPSPNGYLHLGHALSALITQDMAARFGGRLLLRIEDIDVARCSKEFEEQILEDLSWLGLCWEEPVRRQSAHMDFYAKGVQKLEALGVLYRCYAARREIRDAAASSHAPTSLDPDGAPLYPGRGKVLPAELEHARGSQGASYALRLDMEKAVKIAQQKSGGALTFHSLTPDGQIQNVQVDPTRWGDVVIARKDAPTSYHLSVVMDDALQAVTHVTRGEDLRAATDIHRVLQILLDLPDPLYFHHPLLLDDAGRKLSKRDKDKSLQSLRLEGASADDVRKMVGLSG